MEVVVGIFWFIVILAVIVVVPLTLNWLFTGRWEDPAINYQCPHCGGYLTRVPKEGETGTCSNCGNTYTG